MASPSSPWASRRASEAGIHRPDVAPDRLRRAEGIGRGHDAAIARRMSGSASPERSARAAAARPAASRSRRRSLQAALEPRPVDGHAAARGAGAARRRHRASEGAEQPERQRLRVDVRFEARARCRPGSRRRSRSRRSGRRRPRPARRGARRAARTGRRRRARPRTGRPSAAWLWGERTWLTRPRSRGSTISRTAATACIARPDAEQGDVQVRAAPALAPPRRA